jgi:uncharacterized protein (DUF2147 family)
MISHLSLFGIRITVLVFFALLRVSVATAQGATNDDIIGIWLNEENDARINIYQCGQEYCGRIVWTKDGPEFDMNNPNPQLRARPIVGLIIMHGFHYTGHREWSGGELYDPKSGNTYRCKMNLASLDTLKLRGYVFFSLFGRTTTWKRFKQNVEGPFRNT